MKENIEELILLIQILEKFQQNFGFKHKICKLKF